MLAYIQEIICPYVSQVRDRINVNEEQSALVIFDHFKSQVTDKVLQLLEAHNIQSVLVPASCTDRLQPLDISVNKSAKSFLKSQFEKWYSDQVSQQLSNSNDSIEQIEPVDVTTAGMKNVSAQWMEQMHNHFCMSPDIIVNGFKAIAQSISARKPVLDDAEYQSEPNDSTDDDGIESSVLFLQ